MSDERPQADTLDLIYEVTRQGPAHQFQELQALDGKNAQVFSVASVVIGLASLAPEREVYLLALAVVAYVVVALASLWSVWVRPTRRPFHSDSLLDDYWQREAPFVKYALAREMPQIYTHNQKIIDRKACAARAAILATAVEAMAVGLMVILVA
jgi:hypothetical protein